MQRIRRIGKKKQPNASDIGLPPSLVAWWKRGPSAKAERRIEFS
jgi:hypothetical protein